MCKLPSVLPLATVAASAALLMHVDPAHASTGVEPIASALAAYGHYLSIILVVMSLVTERILIKPGMSEDDFDTVANADIVYGVSGLLLTFTGYLRATMYGKGWEFYAHEPIFWLKLVLLAITGSASFFPTIKIVQRAVAKKQAEGSIAPMSDKLIARMTQVINAELLAVIGIPLSATLMARGVGYADWLPWQLGAAPVALAFGGFGYKYVKEALDWSDEVEGPTKEFAKADTELARK